MSALSLNNTRMPKMAKLAGINGLVLISHSPPTGTTLLYMGNDISE